jgi:hypothetical protein
VIGESYEVEQDDPDSKLGPMKRGDVDKNFVPYAPVKVGSAYYKNPKSEQAFPVCVENIIVHDIQLLGLPKQPETASRTSLCTTFNFLACLSSPKFFS